MTLDFPEECRKIHEATRLDTIVVFSIRGDVYFFSTSETKKYKAMLKDFPKSFIGVYDHRCNLKDIQENIL